MPLIEAAKNAIRSEMTRLSGQLSHLAGVLKDLEKTPALQAAPTQAGKVKGKPKASKAIADPERILAIIKEAGKAGINAVSLGHQARKAGLEKVPTAQLVELGVKVTGSKGSTKYTYKG